MEFTSTSYSEYINLKELATGKEYNICLSTHKDGEILGVSSDYDKSWFYFIQLQNASDYSRVRYDIMEHAFECETMKELLDVLSDLLVEGFEASTLDTEEYPDIIDIEKFFQ